jgi:hypothetical protein
MKTLILEIDELDQVRGGYPVSVYVWSENGLQKPPIAEGLIAGDLTVPGLQDQFSAEGLRTLWAQAAGQDPDLLKAGAQIHAILSRCGVGNVLEPAGQRLILDIRPPELQNLPWELMNTPDGELRFGDTNRPVCRGHLEMVPALVPLEWPLRLLVVLASSPSDEAVQGGAEMEALLDALMHCDPDVDLLVLKQPSKADLVAECQRFKPHIFHFIGHGRVEGDKAWLELTQKDGQTIQEWTTLSIRNDNLGGELRLVFINACRSSDVRETGLPSVTEAFLRTGVPAVVGMTSDVNGTDAGRFAGRFYKSLAEGKALDIAMAEARQAVWEHRVDGPQRREWAAPCLYVQAHPEQILKIGEFRGIEQQRRQAVQTMRDFRKNRIFVDRRNERYLTWRRIADAAVQIQSPGLMVIRGESAVGKSEFAKTLLERCFIYGYDILYVDMNKYFPGGSTRFNLCRDANFLTVLRAIRDIGIEATGGLRRPFPPENFYPFNRKINEILRKVQPCRELSDNEQQQLDADPNLDKWRSNGTDGYNKAFEIFKTFLPCLSQCTNERPLVIVLDQLELVNRDNLSLIYSELLKPCLEDDKIRFVLPLRADTEGTKEMEKHRGEFTLIEMREFSEQDWEELAAEYIVRYWSNEEFATLSEKHKHTEQARQRIPEIRKRIEGSWKPTNFVDLIRDSL